MKQFEFIQHSDLKSFLSIICLGRNCRLIDVALLLNPNLKGCWLYLFDIIMLFMKKCF